MNGSFWKVVRVVLCSVTLLAGLDSQASACLFPCLFGGWGYANYAPANYGYGGGSCGTCQPYGGCGTCQSYGGSGSCGTCQPYGGCGTCQPYGGWYRPSCSYYWPSSCGYYTCNPCSCSPCGTCGISGCSPCGVGCSTGCSVEAPAGNATPPQPRTFKGDGTTPETKGWERSKPNGTGSAAPPARLEPGTSPGDLGPSGALQQQETRRVPPADQVVPQSDKAKAKDDQKTKPTPPNKPIDETNPAAPATPGGTPQKGNETKPAGSDATPAAGPPLKVAQSVYQPLRELDNKITWRAAVPRERLTKSTQPASVTVARKQSPTPRSLKTNDGWVPVNESRLANR